MSKLSIARRCYSCGAILQNDDKKKEGFIDSKFLDSSLDTILFCNKCYNEEKFNERPHEPVANPEFITMLKDAAASDALIVYVVDLWSFECSFIEEITSIIANSSILVVGNKRDLLPKELNDDCLREYVAHRFRVAKLPVKSNDVILGNLSLIGDSSEIGAIIEEKRRRHDVYVIGSIGAGKTFFLSSFLRHFKNVSSRNIVTKAYPGTSIRVMQIPLDSSSSIYDTPGTSIVNSYLSKVENSLVTDITPREAVEGKEITINEGESLFIGGLARIDMTLSPKGKTDLACFFSPEIKLKKDPANHDHDYSFASLIEKKALTPITRIVTNIKELDVYDVRVEETGPRDIGIAGLGWISFIGEGQSVRLYVPRGVSVYTSRAKVKKSC